MGLDMYLYAEKYNSECMGLCEYPKELAKVARSLFSRSPRSVNAKYKIGYWRKEWGIHEVIMANASDKTENTADLTKDDMALIIDTLEGLKFNAKYKSEEAQNELDYSIALFREALRLAREEGYDITYYASW